MRPLERLTRGWRALTEPHPSIEGHARSRARLLATLLVPLIPLTIAASVLSPLLRETPQDPLLVPGSISGLATAASLAAIYAIARTRHAGLAAQLTVCVSAGSILVAAWVNRAAPDRSVTLYFLGAGVLLSSLFLTFRSTAVLAVGEMLALPLLSFVAPEFTPLDVVSPGLFLALVSALVLVHAWLRERDQAALDRKQRELGESEERYHALSEIDRFRAEFINVAAHELSTPLTPIRLQVHMLGREAESLPERTRRAITLIDRNVQRLSSLVADLLESARVQSNRLALKSEPVDLNAIALEVLETFHENANQAQVKLVSHLEPGATITADGGRLTQVLFNLVSNAVKYTPPGGDVTVSTRHEGDGVHVEVADTGAGMTYDQLGQLFRPFSKVHEGTTLARPGTGLGLYISKGIVESHGGALGARSAGPGRGSTFWFRVPRERASAPDPVDRLPKLQ